MLTGPLCQFSDRFAFFIVPLCDSVGRVFELQRSSVASNRSLRTNKQEQSQSPISGHVFSKVFRSCRASLAGRSPSLWTAYGQRTNPSAETVLKLAQERIASQRSSSTRAQSDGSSRGLVRGTPQFRFPPLRTSGVQPRRHIQQPRRIGSGCVRRRRVKRRRVSSLFLLRIITARL